MQVIILAGGRGTRLQELTRSQPKPLVDLCGEPVLVHVMRMYARQGHDRFVIALGYLADSIVEYFEGARSDGTLDIAALAVNGEQVGGGAGSGWSVQLVDTGAGTATGGRIRRLAGLLDAGPFHLAWSDGLSDIDFNAMLSFHKRHGKLATVAAVHPPGRFGRLALDGDRVSAFAEKEPLPSEWINGGNFILEPQALDYIEGDDTAFEHGPMQTLAGAGQLMAFRHAGFWQCMDNAIDRERLQALCAVGPAPWCGGG